MVSAMSPPSFSLIPERLVIERHVFEQVLAPQLSLFTRLHELVEWARSSSSRRPRPSSSYDLLARRERIRRDRLRRNGAHLADEALPQRSRTLLGELFAKAAREDEEPDGRGTTQTRACCWGRAGCSVPPL